MYWQIAIDGPAGAGKSTIAKEVAQRLDFTYVDTGAMYRAVTLKALNLKINMEDEAEYAFLESTKIDFKKNHIYLDNKDVSNDIRSLEVTNNVSLVSKFKYVRKTLVALQQSLAKSKNIIMDGRDIGTVVLPKANLKIFLVASVAERAARRLKERQVNGSNLISLEETIAEIEQRDFKDSHRAISPLAKATDAIEIDTSLLSVNDVVNQIISLVMERGYKMENVKTELNVETSVAEATEEKDVRDVVQEEVQEINTEVQEVNEEKQEVNEEKQEVNEEKQEVNEEKQEVNEEVQEINAEVQEVNEEEQEVNEEEQEEVLEEVDEEEQEEVLDDEETTADPQVESVRELQLVEGTVVKLFDAAEERKNREGKVIRKAKDERVLIRLENGQEGFLFKKDVANIQEDEALNGFFLEGDQVKVIVKRVYPDGGKLLFSTILVTKRENIKKFDEIIKNHGTFVAKVVRSIKVGLLLEYEDYTCLLPNSQLDIDEENTQNLVGTELEVAPIRIDYNRIRLIVSHKVAKAIRNRAEKLEFISKVKIGQVFDGVVKNIESYGAFVELVPGVEGLLHISEIEHNRIVKVEKVLNVGDDVKVQVIKVDKDHIGLSRKALLPNYWKEFMDTHEVDDIVSGNIIEINNAGVVVTLTEEIQAFLPKSEFGWERDTYIEDFVQVGDQIETKIIELDLNKKRIILSRKKLTDNPWDTLKYRSGDSVKAIAVKVMPEGVKVLVNGVYGFLPKNNYQPGTEFVEGQEFDTRVRVFDPNRTRLILTMREEKTLDKNSVNRYLKSQERVTSTFGDFIDFDDFKKVKK